MKNKILVIMLLTVISSCRHEEQIKTSNVRENLTRNTPYEARWMFVLPELDSIDVNNIPYYLEFPKNTSISGSRLIFGLQSLNKDNSIYLRTTEFQDPNGPGFLYCSDSINVQTLNNDSIITRIAGYSSNDSIYYSSYTFHGKYNNRTKNIEGFIDNYYTGMRCTTCPGKVYRYYEGKFPAMFIPINY